MKRFYHDGIEWVLVEIIHQVGKMFRVYVCEGRYAGRIWVVELRKLKRGEEVFAERIGLS